MVQAASSQSDSSVFPYTDLHADTAMNQPGTGPLAGVWKVLTKPLPHFYQQVNESNLQRRVGGAQVFSITMEGFPPAYRQSHRFYSSVVAGAPRYSDATRFNTVVNQMGWIYGEVDKYPAFLHLGLDAQGHEMPSSDQSLAVYIGIEGAAFLSFGKKDIDDWKKFLVRPDNGLPTNLPLPTDDELASLEGRVSYLKRVGVLYVGLNHLNGDDFSGSGFFFSKHHGSGLSEQGKQLVQLLNQAGILVDLAHASHQTQLDMIGLSELPLIVSHGYIATKPGQAPNWRQTDPKVLQEIKRTGGLFGVILSSYYLKEGVKAFVDQIDALKHEMGGVDNIAIGSDADGFVNLIIKDMDISPVVTEMKKRGYTEADIQKILVGNFERMMQARESCLADR